MNSNSKVRKIAFVGDHLPRKCGIATFTSDLLAAVAGAFAVAVGSWAIAPKRHPAAPSVRMTDRGR